MNLYEKTCEIVRIDKYTKEICENVWIVCELCV